MLTIAKTKKNGLVLSHEGRTSDQVIEVKVGDQEKEFIRENIENISFDITGQNFYVTQTTRKGTTRTTLQRALWKSVKGSKVPAKIVREDKFDFRVDGFQKAA